MPWTKLESANILFKKRRQGNMGSLLDQQYNIREPLNIFIMVFSSVWLTKRKEIQRNALKYFWSFFGFLEEGKIKERETKTRKTIYTGNLPTSKRNIRKYFCVFFLVLLQLKLGRKIKKKQEINFWIFSKFFKHTRRKRENKFSMDNTMKECGHRQLEWNV